MAGGWRVSSGGSSMLGNHGGDDHPRRERLEASFSAGTAHFVPPVPPSEMNFARLARRAHPGVGRDGPRAGAGCPLGASPAADPAGGGLAAFAPQPQAARVRPGGPRRLPGRRRGHQPAPLGRVRALRLPQRAQRPPPRARRPPDRGGPRRMAVGGHRREAACRATGGPTASSRSPSRSGRWASYTRPRSVPTCRTCGPGATPRPCDSRSPKRHRRAAVPERRRAAPARARWSPRRAAV